MSITVMERVDSRPLIMDPKGCSAAREYWAQSTDIEEDVLPINNAVAVAAPDTYLGLVKKSIKSKHLGSGFWHVSVDYGVLEGGAMDAQGEEPSPDMPPEPTGSTPLTNDQSFGTGGGTVHIVRSKQTVSKVGRNGVAAPDQKQAIGVTFDGTVEGTDIVAPKFEFQITKRVAGLNRNYIKNLVKCTAKTNQLEWHSFEAGALLFLGADGKYDGNGIDDNSWLVTYKFALGNNETAIQITPGLVVGEKKAWDYLWVGFVDDVSEGKPVRVPTYAYVERVYDWENYRTLLGF